MVFQWICRRMGCSKKIPDSTLTAAEIQAVKAVWAKAKRRDVGQHILRSLIELKPQFKDYFGIKVSEDQLHKLYDCKESQVQAHRIQNFLDTAVSTLGFCPMANVFAMAHRIGQIHYYRGVNFGADNWLAFKKVTVDEVNAEIQKSADGEKTVVRKESLLELPLHGVISGPCLALIGWEKFMGAIVREMKTGFLDEARRNCTDETATEG